MIDWKKKLTSRKFWAAVAEFVTMLVIALGGTQETAVQITALIMAGAGVIAYIIGEGLIDTAAMKTPFYTSYFGGEEPPDSQETN